MDFLVSPCKPCIVTSCFGPRPRVKADGRPGPLHPGLDLRCNYGQDVFAACDGVVARSYLSDNIPADWRPGARPPEGWAGPWPRIMGYGETIVVAHQDGHLTRYAHLAQRLVYEGDRVSAGQVIGRAGTTGYSFGVHLHFELRSDGGRSLLDPLPLLMAGSPDVVIL